MEQQLFGAFFGPFLSLPEGSPLAQAAIEEMAVYKKSGRLVLTLRFTQLVPAQTLFEAERELASRLGLGVVVLQPRFPADLLGADAFPSEPNSRSIRPPGEYAAAALSLPVSSVPRS